MEYKGKLYGHLGGKKYFDTGHTTDEWDKMVKALIKARKYLKKAEIEAMKIEAELWDEDIEIINILDDTLEFIGSKYWYKTEQIENEQ